MTNLIIIILGLVVVGVGIYMMVSDYLVSGIIFAVIGIVCAILGASFSFVPSGYVGVRTAYGQISDKPTIQGINWHIPFVEQIHNVNCKQQEKDFGELRIWSETAERTEVYCENVVVDYQINAEYAAWIWINVEEWDTNLVKQTSIESGIKAATKTFNDTDVKYNTEISGLQIRKQNCQYCFCNNWQY